ncbi:hypothetical protein ACFRAR_04165 [Kitasatospora sp. NPDC056651]
MTHVDQYGWEKGFYLTVGDLFDPFDFGGSREVITGPPQVEA